MAGTIVSFVLSGGVGTRLWPLSRDDNPKQFHDLTGGGSMLANTVRRMLAREAGPSPVHVIAAAAHSGRVRAELAGLDLGGGGALFEPTGRNTAAAVALATIHTLERHGDVAVLVVPSDHAIQTTGRFWETVETGLASADSGAIVVFGIPPTRAETGYGYIEVPPGEAGNAVAPVRRFVEKPDAARAEEFLAAGNFYWNSGIFLFRAGAMRDAFRTLRPDIWDGVEAANGAARAEAAGLFLPDDLYGAVPSISVDYAIMEHTPGIAMVKAGFAWSDVGSWKSLHELQATHEGGNVISGNVVAVDCEGSHLRSDGPLLAAVGLRDMAVVATQDATFVAPLARSQDVRLVHDRLRETGRREVRETPMPPGQASAAGAMRRRVEAWLRESAFPAWAQTGIDRGHGGFHEVIAFDGAATGRPRRIRTMARQVYAFALAEERGWLDGAHGIVAHGLAFLQGPSRSQSGGWVRTVATDGRVLDPAEDAYDHACVLLALAQACRAGHEGAEGLAGEAMDAIDRLADAEGEGWMETAGGGLPRRSNPHMHLLEGFLALHGATGDGAALERAGKVADLLHRRFLDPQTWTLGEYFDAGWKPAAGEQGDVTEPGHHFEWAALLCDHAALTGRQEDVSAARKLYAHALAFGINRHTGLAHGATGRDGRVIEPASRSWMQAEALRAAIALDGAGVLDAGPEVEARVALLFDRHIEPAPRGYWIDRIDGDGRHLSQDVPASILYHLSGALAAYLDWADRRSA